MDGSSLQETRAASDVVVTEIERGGENSEVATKDDGVTALVKRKPVESPEELGCEVGLWFSCEELICVGSDP
jgi:hypothetical protein